MHRPLLAALLLALPVGGARAQTLDGQVVEPSTQAALVGVPVRLIRIVDSTASVVDSTRTDARGLFQLATAPGVYQLEIGRHAPHTRYSPVDTLRGDTTVTRRYGLPVLAWADSMTVTDADLDSMTAIPGHGSPPRYPERLRARGVGGTVFVLFTLDSAGQVGPGSTRFVTVGDGAFEGAVRNAFGSMQFRAPRVGGLAVPQQACMPISFAVARGDSRTIRMPIPAPPASLSEKDRTRCLDGSRWAMRVVASAETISRPF